MSGLRLGCRRNVKKGGGLNRQRRNAVLFDDNNFGIDKFADVNVVGNKEDGFFGEIFPE